MSFHVVPANSKQSLICYPEPVSNRGAHIRLPVVDAQQQLTLRIYCYDSPGQVQ